MIVNVKCHFGYILKEKSVSQTKEYRLALRAVVQYADKNGYIGSKKYFVKSSKRKTTSNKELPAFRKSDFKSIQIGLKTQIRADLKKLKSAS